MRRRPLPRDGTADAGTLIATARTIALTARLPDGTDSPDRGGEHAWENKGVRGEHLKVSVQAVAFIQAGYAVSK